MTSAAKRLACGLLVLGTVLGLAGIDLVLPAIPGLPLTLGGSDAAAQGVIAAFVAGIVIGLIVFGMLGDRLGRRNCLAFGLVGYGLASIACVFAPNIDVLIAMRALQGLLSAAPAVFAPGIIRALFSEAGATRAIGVLSSIESLTPAGAPIAGLWLLSLGGWQASFWVTGLLAGALGLIFLLAKDQFPATPTIRGQGSYVGLLLHPVFLRYAVSHACVVGGLLIFVFGAPAVMVNAMDGTMTDFIRMQVVGIACFILASNVTGLLVDRFGAETLIWFGTVMAFLGAVAVLVFSLLGDGNPAWLTLLFIPVNAGLGFRGPPGFLRAILAGQGDDDRAASLTILAIFAIAASGTAAVAPFIAIGLVPLAATAAAIQLIAVLSLACLPKLKAATDPSAAGGPKST